MAGKSARKASARHVLQQELDRLKAKYPPDVYAGLPEEPEEILAYVRSCIRWADEHNAAQWEARQMAWTGR